LITHVDFTSITSVIVAVAIAIGAGTVQAIAIAAVTAGGVIEIAFVVAGATVIGTGIDVGFAAVAAIRVAIAPTRIAAVDIAVAIAAIASGGMLKITSLPALTTMGGIGQETGFTAIAVNTVTVLVVGIAAIDPALTIDAALGRSLEKVAGLVAATAMGRGGE